MPEDKPDIQKQIEQKLDLLIKELTTKASEMAYKSWKEAVSKGVVGNMSIPDRVDYHTIAERFYLSGYAIAIVDYAMNAAQEIRKLRAEQQEAAVLVLKSKVGIG